MDKLSISVIIPIYGVEQYIERCARSLFEQTLNVGVEYIFIDDASKDKSGEYVMHVDGDDYLEKETLELLYHTAKANKADVVWSDYYITFESKKRVIKQPSFNTPQNAVRGMLRGTMKYNVWNKLCKRSLYSDNSITFPEGQSMGEDLTMIMVFLHARSCAYVDSALYNYVQSPNQMTATYTEEKFESLRYNCNRISQYIDRNFSENDYRSEYS